MDIEVEIGSFGRKVLKFGTMFVLGGVLASVFMKNSSSSEHTDGNGDAAHRGVSYDSVLDSSSRHGMNSSGNSYRHEMDHSSRSPPHLVDSRL